MNCRILFLFAFLCSFGALHGQDQNLAVSGISRDMMQNANAVLRDEQITIGIEAVDKMTIYTKRIVTVLNEYGESHVEAYEFYDKDRKVKKQQAIIYNAAGAEVKKYKQKDFAERSAVSSGSLYSDDRVQYLNHTAHEYPYTVVYESEVRTGTTVFIPPWNPISGYFLSVQKSNYIFQNPLKIQFRLEEKNLDEQLVKKSSNAEGFKYTTGNLFAYKPELLSPALDAIVPRVRVALNEFSLVGVRGKATNWQEFGKWQYDNLLAGRNNIPQSTIEKIGALTITAKGDVEKAKIIYQYVQENTRYISVQLGIGGWEPMMAQDVDRLGYGDCKALTNYTKALLDSQGITSFYAVVFAGEDRKDLDKDFASMQGNHVILNIPQKEEDIWLECTSQTTPFNYLGDFTDNRNVLLVKPGGGEIARTKVYSFSENLRETFSSINIEESGFYTAKVRRSSSGISYGNIYHLQRETRENQVLFYKNIWGHLQDLNFIDISYVNNRQEKMFSEEINFSGQKIATKAGNRLLLPTNFFLAPTLTTPRTSDRKQPLEIERGHTYKDTFEFILPGGFEVESLPLKEFVETQFGTYKLGVEKREKAGVISIEVVREYILYEGVYAASLYDDFREFMNRINSLNNQKAVIVAKT